MVNLLLADSKVKKMLNSDKLCIENIINQTRSSEKKFREGDFKGSIRALRRSEKYLAKKICSVWFFYKFRFHRYIAIFSYLIMVMPQSTLESLLFFLVLSLLASYLVKIKYGSNFKVQK